MFERVPGCCLEIGNHRKSHRDCCLPFDMRDQHFSEDHERLTWDWVGRKKPGQENRQEGTACACASGVRDGESEISFGITQLSLATAMPSSCPIPLGLSRSTFRRAKQGAHSHGLHKQQVKGNVRCRSCHCHLPCANPHLHAHLPLKKPKAFSPWCNVSALSNVRLRLKHFSSSYMETCTLHTSPSKPRLSSAVPKHQQCPACFYYKPSHLRG